MISDHNSANDMKYILSLLIIGQCASLQAKIFGKTSPENEKKIISLTESIEIFINGRYAEYDAVYESVKNTRELVQDTFKNRKTAEAAKKNPIYRASKFIIIPANNTIKSSLTPVIYPPTINQEAVAIPHHAYDYAIDKLLLELIKLCELGDDEIPVQQRAHLVSLINSHLVVRELFLRYEDIVNIHFHLLNPIIKENLRLLSEELSYLEELKYISYRTKSTKKQTLTEFILAHPNDAVAFMKRNQDRELTGGLNLQFGTNYLSRENFSIANILNDPTKPYLSYQSIGLVAYAYTPYIRYRDQTAIADSLFQNDRPFSNIIMFTHNTFRLWPRGRYRDNAMIAVGTIGNDVPRQVQAVLHRDAVVESQLVYGWDTQIAEGGRLFLQVNYTGDILMYSNTNKYGSVLFPRLRKPKQPLIPLNVYLSPFVNWGGYKTSGGFQLSLSTVDLVSSSMLNGISSRPSDGRIKKWQIAFEAGLRTEYVVHNSTLEGFGYLRTFRDDDYDDEATSSYTLNQHFYEEFEQTNSASEDFVYPFYINRTGDEVQRVLCNWFGQIQLRRGRATLFYRVEWFDKEYVTTNKANGDFNYQSSAIYDLISGDNAADRDAAKEFYDTKVDSEQKPFDNWDYYPVGTLGINIQL